MAPHTRLSQAGAKQNLTLWRGGHAETKRGPDLVSRIPGLADFTHAFKEPLNPVVTWHGSYWVPHPGPSAFAAPTPPCQTIVRYRTEQPSQIGVQTSTITLATGETYVASAGVRTPRRKVLRTQNDDFTHEPLPERWVELILQKRSHWANQAETFQEREPSCR